MYITDFMFDGEWLGDKGYMVCSFGSGSQSEIPNGGNIEFKTTPIFNGERFLLAKSIYPEVITATLQICKKTCVADYDPAMTVDEISKLTAWLCRKYFCDLVVDAPGYFDEDHPENTIYFTGSFTKVTRVEFGGMTIGLTLEFVSNAPFARREMVEETLTLEADIFQSIDINTDYVGDFHPDYMEIACTSDEDLIIRIDDGSRAVASRTITAIHNCVIGEVIELYYPEIYSSERDGSELANNFNFIFPKFEAGTNRIKSNVNCSVYFGYSPIVNISI